MMNAVARPYAKVAGGVAQSMSWDGATLIIGVVSGNRSNEHEVFFPGPTPNISAAATCAGIAGNPRHRNLDLCVGCDSG